MTGYSRGDQRNIGTGSASRGSRVAKRRLNQSATLAVEATAAGLQVRNSGGEWAVAGEVATSGQDATTLDESGLFDSISRQLAQ